LAKANMLLLLRQPKGPVFYPKNGEMMKTNRLSGMVTEALDEIIKSKIIISNKEVSEPCKEG